MSRYVRIAAVAVAAISIGCLILAFADAEYRARGSIVGLAWPLPNIVVGLLLTIRRPGLLTGWLFAAIGFLVTTGTAAEVIAANGLRVAGEAPWWAVTAVWYGEWYWLPMIYTMLIFLPLLFPTGRPLTARWRRITRAIAVVLAVLTVAAMLQETLDPERGLPTANPIGIIGLGDVEDGLAGSVLALLTGICLLTAGVGLVTRYRRSRGVERQQLKWFTSAGVVLIVGFIVQGASDAFLNTRIEIIDIVLFALPPIAAAIAVFRYRLYAIDRIISRTVTYFLVTALLIGVYVAAVAVMSVAIDPLAGESPLAVAIATLTAAAAFRPVRHRIQRVVDRRFNRARYDIEQTLESFRDRVRSDVDLDRLCADLVAVTDDALQPAAATVWLRRERP
jgi:hypothetical protein